MDDSPTETRQARKVDDGSEQGKKRERLAFFYYSRRRRLNSVRQVNGDLPHPVVSAASVRFSTLSAHFSTLSTHARVWVFCLPYAPQRCGPLIDRPHFTPIWRETGETCTRAPSESGNSRLTCRREVKSEAARDIVYDDDHGFDIRLTDQVNVRCATALHVAWMRYCGTFDDLRSEGMACSSYVDVTRKRHAKGIDNCSAPTMVY